MNIRPHRNIKRRKTKKIQVGNVSVGGDSVISVQSMTNTLTTDIKGTINQILELQNAGADVKWIARKFYTYALYEKDTTISTVTILKNIPNILINEAPIPSVTNKAGRAQQIRVKLAA